MLDKKGVGDDGYWDFSVSTKEEHKPYHTDLAKAILQNVGHPFDDDDISVLPHNEKGYMQFEFLGAKNKLKNGMHMEWAYVYNLARYPKKVETKTMTEEGVKELENSWRVYMLYATYFDGMLHQRVKQGC